MKTPIQYAAYIEKVKEVTLYGVADLAFWREVLKGENLVPYADGGKAGILISAPNLLWKGARFSELSVSVLVSDWADGSSRDGYFLLHAFNSLKLFAFAERTVFRTPYYHAGIDVCVQAPSNVQVWHGEEAVFEVKMNGERPPLRSGIDEFEGPVHLPGGKNYFVARIVGETDFYPFSSTDSLMLKGTKHERVFQQLLDSGFTPLEWRVRENATHGKSKTYRRS